MFLESRNSTTLCFSLSAEEVSTNTDHRYVFLYYDKTQSKVSTMDIILDLRIELVQNMLKPNFMIGTCSCNKILYWNKNICIKVYEIGSTAHVIRFCVRIRIHNQSISNRMYCPCYKILFWKSRNRDTITDPKQTNTRHDKPQA